ncbi:hypothetical protein GW781_09405 [bacterium]|nr:hypothetical protein [bacterium]NCT21356.1 hypothetical protein [bacterium]
MMRILVYGIACVLLVNAQKPVLTSAFYQFRQSVFDSYNRFLGLPVAFTGANLSVQGNSNYLLYLPLVVKNYPSPADILTFCKRPYQETSIWNTPINWVTARIHPDSSQMMSAFFKTRTSIGSDPSQYAPNIYFVTNQTPLVSVALWSKSRFQDAIDDTVVYYGQKGASQLAPIPLGALPAPGTDGELVVINIDTGEEWGINHGQVDQSGHWTAGGLYRYHIWNSGLPPAGFSQRGAGVGALAGIVRPCEVQRGDINHAVTIAYNYPCSPSNCVANGFPAFIPPFKKTDGTGSWRYDIPEGAHLAIRPEITLLEIEQVCGGLKGCIVWARAMQTYGGYIVDRSGHPKTYGEGNITAQWTPDLWTSNMLTNIPQSWYVILDWRVQG